MTSVITDTIMSDAAPNPTHEDTESASPGDTLKSATVDSSHAADVTESHLSGTNDIKASPELTEDQKEAYNTVISEIYRAQDTSKGNLFFLNGPVDTGKTWLLRHIMTEVLSRRDIALYVDRSGIDACLFDSGRKVKIHMSLTNMDTLTCNDDRHRDGCCCLAPILKQTKLIAWDNCTRMDKEGYEELDRTLREVWGKNVLFAGIPVLLADDFRQTFPAIKNGTPADLELSHLFAILQPYWTASSS